MADNKSNRGGTHEQHVKAGQQSHKNMNQSTQQQQDSGSGGAKQMRGGTPEQHAKAGRQSHKNK